MVTRVWISGNIIVPMNVEYASIETLVIIIPHQLCDCLRRSKSIKGDIDSLRYGSNFDGHAST